MTGHDLLCKVQVLLGHDDWAAAGSLCRKYAIPYLQGKLMIGKGCGLPATSILVHAHL